MSVLVAEHLRRTFTAGGHQVTALDDLSLVLEAGRSLAITGPSGSGKSTLLGLLAGLDRPDGGRVVVEGRDLASLDDAELSAFRGRRMGFLFQSYRLLATLSAEDNVRLPLDLAGVAGAGSIARDWLDRVGLSARRNHRPAQLSGGEQQRVALARALAPRPALLFCDEPTGNLDQTTGATIAGLIFQAVHETGAACAYVTHDDALAARADAVLQLRSGKVRDDGTP
jgi:putative ABC transport system ATP-binding protein